MKNIDDRWNQDEWMDQWTDEKWTDRNLNCHTLLEGVTKLDALEKE